MKNELVFQGESNDSFWLEAAQGSTENSSRHIISSVFSLGFGAYLLIRGDRLSRLHTLEGCPIFLQTLQRLESHLTCSFMCVGDWTLYIIYAYSAYYLLISKIFFWASECKDKYSFFCCMHKDAMCGAVPLWSTVREVGACVAHGVSWWTFLSLTSQLQ